MGLFDQVAGAVAGAAGTAGTSGEGGNPMLGTIMQLLNDPKIGGLSGLVQSFQKGGLGEIVNSWVSKGPNLPVSASQIQSVLGNEQVGNIAGKLGVSPDQASGQIAEFLPQIVDKLTPNGSLPEGGDMMAQGVDLLKGKLFG